MTDQELRDAYNTELFNEWSSQRLPFLDEDMYRQFSRFLTDKLFDVTEQKQFEGVGE